MSSLEYISTSTVSEDKVYSMIHKCKKCPYITKSLFFIRNHVRRHLYRGTLTLFGCTKSNLENYICGDCEFSTYEVVTFRQHLRNHHNVKKEELEGNSQRQSEYGLKVINETHLAEYYYSKRFIENDLSKFECLLEISKSELNHNVQHKAADDSQWSQCDDASYKTQIKTHLEKHTFQKRTEYLKKIEWFKWNPKLRNLIWEEVKWFNCNKCSFKTRSLSSLTSHMLIGHSAPEKSNWFLCYHCSYKSQSKEDVRKHVFQKHKWFHCDHCPYKSKCKVTLQKHSLFKHTAPEGLKWLQCDYCSYKGKMKIQLKRHLLNQHTSPENYSQILREAAVRAVEDDTIQILRDVIGSHPEITTLVDDRLGLNLLCLSAFYERVEIFDYLLSLNCFDLEETTPGGKTILEMIIDSTNYKCIPSPIYYISRLIEAGANIHSIRENENTYLHKTMSKQFLEISELLIKSGADLNIQNSEGRTPLHEAIRSGCSQGLLNWALYYGADPTICDYEGHLPLDFALHCKFKFWFIEHLFNLTFDFYPEYKISSESLHQFLRHYRPLLDRVLEVVSEVVYTDDFFFEPVNFIVMKPNILKIMIEKFGWFVRRVLLYEQTMFFFEYVSNMENWEILLESEMISETIQFIGQMNLASIFRIGGTSSEEVTNVIFYLLTYGLDVTSIDYEYVYEAVGYCDLFKMMLHVGVTNDLNISRKKYICERSFKKDFGMSRIIYDLNYDVETFLPNIRSVPTCRLESFLDYFAHPQLRTFCEMTDKASLVQKAKQLPTVPLLLELARNATRKHLIKWYNLQNPRQYYSILKRLSICETLEKILSFETKLYE